MEQKWKQAQTNIHGCGKKPVQQVEREIIPKNNQTNRDNK